MACNGNVPAKLYPPYPGFSNNKGKKRRKKLAPLQAIEFLILRLLNFTYNQKVEAIIPIFISEKNEV